jgi:hypothetical protein
MTGVTPEAQGRRWSAADYALRDERLATLGMRLERLTPMGTKRQRTPVGD